MLDKKRGARVQCINSKTIQQRYGEDYEEFFSECSVVVSAPGTLFIAGEKAVVHGATATCLRVPRRVHVGITSPKTPGVRRFQVSKSLLMEEGEDFPKSPTLSVENRDSYASLAEPLRALETAYILWFGEDPPNLDISIWSEWKGESGLGWSGAFSVALVSALLIFSGRLGEEVFRDWESMDPTTLRDSQEFEMVFKVALSVESVIHGGRASGSAVCGSMLSNALPYTYKAPDIPNFWWQRSNPEHGEISKIEFLRNHPKERFEELFNFKDWEFDYVGYRPPHQDPNNTGIVWKELLANRYLMVVHTNVVTTTEDAARGELSSYLYEKLQPARDALVTLCGEVAHTTSNCIKKAAGIEIDVGLDHDWQNLIDLVRRVYGLLMAQGFSFPVAEEVIGVTRSRFAGTTRGRDIGCKTSGKGTGGNLLILAKGFHERRNHLYNINTPDPERRDLYSSIEGTRGSHSGRYEHLGPAQISIMYDPIVDDVEHQGLRVEKAA